MEPSRYLPAIRRPIRASAGPAASSGRPHTAQLASPRRPDSPQLAHPITRVLAPDSLAGWATVPPRLRGVKRPDSQRRLLPPFGTRPLPAVAAGVPPGARPPPPRSPGRRLDWMPPGRRIACGRGGRPSEPLLHLVLRACPSPSPAPPGPSRNAQVLVHGTLTPAVFWNSTRARTAHPLTLVPGPPRPPSARAPPRPPPRRAPPCKRSRAPAGR